MDRLLTAYPGLGLGDLDARIDHAGDHMFGVHVDHASRCHAEQGHSVYRYHFRAVPASPKQTAGAFHAAEVLNVFDTTFPLVPAADDAHLLAREMGDRMVCVRRDRCSECNWSSDLAQLPSGRRPADDIRPSGFERCTPAHRRTGSTSCASGSSG